jgi:endonuclease/exonuclease/phosphatase family metal-dependent hydrolase
VLVRSWNLFHGNTVPPGRRAYLREMIELITADGPDIVCVQEVPGWALGRLGGWAGMTEVAVVARRPRLGPLPVPATFGRALTAPHHGIVRSAFAGQGNAILLAPGLRVLASALLRLGERTRGHDARVAQLAELERLVVANVHCSPSPRGETELASALCWAEEAVRPGDVLIFAGDFNTPPEHSKTIRAGNFSGAVLSSIDQVLVRGAPVASRIWADEEREYGGRLLSDHAPVEATIELVV